MSKSTYVPSSIGSDGKAIPATQILTSKDQVLGLSPKRMVTHLRHLTTDQFKDQLKILVNESKSIKKLSFELGKRGGKATFHDGRELTSVEVNAMQKQYEKKVKSLGSNYQARGTKRKTSNVKKDGTPKKKGDGLERATWINDELASFFAAVNYGARNGEVQAIIRPYLERRFISRGIMAPLLGLYNKLHRFVVMEDKDGKMVPRKYIKADPVLRQYMGKYITQAGLDPEKIVYSSLQTIIKPTTLKKASLDAAKLAVVDDKATIAALKASRLLLTAINESV